MLTRVSVSHVWNADGDLVAVGTRMPPAAGEFATVAWHHATGNATDAPSLEIQLGGMTLGPEFQFDDRTDGHRFFSMAWLANALIVRRAGSSVSPAAAASLRRHRALSHGARDWLVLGPLDDRHATCLDVPRSAELSLNVSAVYSGQNGVPVRWRPATIPASAPLAYLDFKQHGIVDRGGDGGLALALTHVWLDGERAQTVSLTGSTTGVGIAKFGGEVAFKDELNAGLLADEERTDVVLQPGWNRVLVRSCTKWHAEGWGLWLGLEDRQGGPPTGVHWDACGPLC